MIERTIMTQLNCWKDKNNRKPLLLFGARQVGKTSILKYFGSQSFDNYAHFSFDEERQLSEIFEKTKDPIRIIEQLNYLTDSPIVPQKTLIILDEIQECPAAIASLKYFCEKAPEYPVAGAGSLLGLMLGHPGFSFPVGKVDHLDMFPLTFSEFLKAKDTKLFNYYQSINTPAPLPQLFFDKLLDSFAAYRICGGMPEAAVMMLNGDMVQMEEKLSNILKDYSLDFIKHATPVQANRISHVWNSLPSQLAKENHKFVYQLVRPGARAREYEDALVWLKNAGLIYQVVLCKQPSLPLKAYDDLNIFKAYANDIGLLRSLANLDYKIYNTPENIFKEFKGALAENYVLQSLIPQFGKNCHYWSSGNQAEVDFLLSTDNEVYPVEVKSDESITGKSLMQYEKSYAPKLRIRYSMRNLQQDGNLLNIPLFLADRTKAILSSNSV